MPERGNGLAAPQVMDDLRTPQAMDDLRTRIRDRIRDGSLPGVQCLVAWFGSGRGQRCGACTERILGTELAVECDQSSGATIWFHARCYDLWHAALEACPRANL